MSEPKETLPPDFADKGMSVAYIMRMWPETVAVFLRRGMSRCIGCPVGRFHTLRDACRIYGQDLEEFVADLRQAVSPPPSPR